MKFLPLAAFALIAPLPALAQTDRVAANQTIIATILNRTVSGGTTKIGYFPDLFTYSVSSTGGCGTRIVRYQRRVSRGDRYITRQTKNHTINWTNPDGSVTRAKLIDSRNQPGLRLSHGGYDLILGFESEADMEAVVQAMQSLFAECRARARPAPAPVSAPRPTPAPRPAAPPAPKLGDRIEIERIGNGPNYMCRFRNLPRLVLAENNTMAYKVGIAGQTMLSDRLVLWGNIITGTPPDQTPMTGGIHVTLPTGTVGPITGDLLFDGRPSRLPISVYYDPARKQEASVSIKDMQFEIADIVAVTNLTLTLRDKRGATVGSWTFDVSDARNVRAELRAANYRCT